MCDYMYCIHVVQVQRKSWRDIHDIQESVFYGGDREQRFWLCSFS